MIYYLKEKHTSHFFSDLASLEVNELYSSPIDI
jgi:hypothetical protein